MRAARPRTIVTPEHVEIRLDPAGLGSRFVALVIDLAIVLGASSVVAHLALYALPPALGMLVNALALLLLSWGYHVFFEVRAQGQPPGKRIVGIRVVDGRGLPLSVEQSFVRNVVRVLDALPVGYALGALSCLLDPQRRRLGDLAADTLVVREARTVDFERRAARARTFNSLRTPRLLRLARHRVGLEEREFIRALCARGPEMDDRARFDLMEEVARHYRRKLDVEDPHLSGESLVRGLAAVLFADRLSPGRVR